MSSSSSSCRPAGGNSSQAVHDWGRREATAARGGGSPRVHAGARRTAATRRNPPEIRGAGRRHRSRRSGSGPYAQTATARTVHACTHHRRRNMAAHRSQTSMYSSRFWLDTHERVCPSTYVPSQHGTLLCLFRPPAVRVCGGSPVPGRPAGCGPTTAHPLNFCT